MEREDLKETWPTGALQAFTLEKRVGLARLYAYNAIVSARNYTSVYFEDFLNIFIALVQHPINFVLFDSNYKYVYHFCTDLKHKDSFELFIKKQKWNNENTFDLFPASEDDVKYKISVVYMRTKRTRPTESKFETINRVPEYADKCSDKSYEYIGICVERFFSDKWNGLKSLAESQFIEGINRSIENLLDTGQSINKKQNHVDYLGATDHADNIDRALSDALGGIRHGTSFTTSICRHRVVKETTDKRHLLLAYRTYNVPNNYVRHKGKNGGNYKYKTKLVIPNDTTAVYGNILKQLRKKYSFETYYNKNEGRILYSKISRIPDKYEELVNRLDHEFWKLLREENFERSCLDILSSEIGKRSRSLVDPVFSTGLIHFNRIFEEAGLDRVQGLTLDKILSSDGLSLNQESEYYDDTMRIVILYYVFTYMLNSSGDKIKNSDDVMCIIFPVKMKGVTWAVGLQPYNLAAHRSERHEEKSLWLSVFLLTTTLRRRLFYLVDAACWGYSERYVIEAVTQCIDAIGWVIHDRGSVRAAIDELNISMKELSKHLPYDFPSFIFTSKESEDEYKEYVHLPLMPVNSRTNLTWKKEANEFYTPTQKWDRESTRTFNRAIEMGLEIGRRRWVEPYISVPANQSENK